MLGIDSIFQKDIVKYEHSIDYKKKYNIVACIYDKRDRLLSVGRNSHKTHPIQYKYAFRARLFEKYCLHAEIDALIKCRHKPFKIFVMRFRKDKTLGLAKPCVICQIALYDYKVRSIYFTTYTLDVGIL